MLDMGFCRRASDPATAATRRRRCSSPRPCLRRSRLSPARCSQSVMIALAVRDSGDPDHQAAYPYRRAQVRTARRAGAVGKSGASSPSPYQAPRESSGGLPRRNGVAAGRIHGNRSQAQRTEALGGFKAGKFPCWWRRTSGARIDVEELSHVINFDVPSSPRTTSTGRTHGPGRCEGRRLPLRLPREKRTCGASSARSQAAAARHRPRLRLRPAAGRQARRCRFTSDSHACAPTGREPSPILRRIRGPAARHRKQPIGVPPDRRGVDPGAILAVTFTNKAARDEGRGVPAHESRRGSTDRWQRPGVPRGRRLSE